MATQHQTAGDNSTNVQLSVDNLTPEAVRLLVESLGNPLAEVGPLRFTWSDLHDVIIAFGNCANESIEFATSRIYDFKHIDIDEKNIINQMGEDYFNRIKEKHEPHFAKIERFLHDPANEKLLVQYGRTTDELNLKLSAPPMNSNPMETNLLLIGDGLIKAARGKLSEHRSLVYAVLSYMYVSCDLGKKT